MNIENIITDLLLEDTGEHFLDSGGIYGRHFQKNRENGILKGFNPIKEYTNEEYKERSLIITIPLYDLLISHLIKDENTKIIEKSIFKELNENGINPYHIFEVENYLKNNYYSFNICESINSIGINYINTFNGEEYISQTIQFCPFSINDEIYHGDYIILQIHGGCDARGGYTKPQIFKINDIEEFLLGLDYRKCECDCGLNDYYFLGNEVTDASGRIIGDDEIYEKTYVDDEGNVYCKECNSIITGGYAGY